MKNQLRMQRIGQAMTDSLSECLGVHVAYVPHERLDTILKREDLWDEIDVFAVFHDLWETFGLRLDRAEINDLRGPIESPSAWETFAAREWTLQRLAERIRIRLAAVQVMEVSLLGKPCLQAGAFRAVEQVCQELVPCFGRIAPSDLILPRIRGANLRLLWNRLGWMCDSTLPPFRLTAFARVCWAANLTCVIAIFVPILCLLAHSLLHGIVGDFPNWYSPEVYALAGALCIASLIVRGIASHFDNPLPKGIADFRQLAVHLAGPS